MTPAFWVPVSALLFDSSATYVYKVACERAVRQRVSVVRIEHNEATVTGEVREGEFIATRAQMIKAGICIRGDAVQRLTP